MPAQRYRKDHELKDYRSFRENGKKVFEHRSLAEQALGRPLPDGAEVHHMVDFRDNSFLVICQNRKEHMWIHYRQRAFEACGNANWIKCSICKQYDAPSNNMWTQQRPNGKGFRAHHRECAARLASQRINCKHPAVST